MQYIVLPFFAYLVGSISFAYWLGRLVKGVDVRKQGSSHATTTNTIRTAGWATGLPVLLLDIAKGYLPVYLAVQLGFPTWATVLTAAAVVLGHCYPLWSGFKGGMGLATTAGCILVVEPLAMPIGLALLIALTLGLRHGARASVITGVLLAPVYSLFGFQGLLLWMTGVLGLIIAGRFLIDWRREYRELWLDREVEEETSGNG